MYMTGCNLLLVFLSLDLNIVLCNHWQTEGMVLSLRFWGDSFLQQDGQLPVDYSGSRFF
jgi:hypothetical protein